MASSNHRPKVRGERPIMRAAAPIDAAHGAEIAKLIGKVERAGYALVPLDLHFAKGRIKLEIGLAKGKKEYDKRDSEKKKDWEREKGRLMRTAR